jgi:hypothetical protein
MTNPLTTKLIIRSIKHFELDKVNAYFFSFNKFNDVIFECRL